MFVVVVCVWCCYCACIGWHFVVLLCLHGVVLCCVVFVFVVVVFVGVVCVVVFACAFVFVCVCVCVVVIYCLGL